MRRHTRGQTTLDFAIGVSLFLLVLIFIFLFIPGILSPFDQSNQEDTVVTNRIADQIATGVLADPTEPYTLDTHCTVQFFDNETNECTNEAPLDRQFNVDLTNQNVNVTIRGNATTTAESDEQLCWGGSKNRIVESGNASCDIPLQRGASPPRDNDASVTAQRAVLLNGQDVTVFVVVW
ncbi:MAG: hypothetical protein V5A34_08920 [Halapricum sp.]